MKKVLMIAFHYPPVRGSSGVQRTLSFSRDLSDFGWQPTVLTVSEGAFELKSPDQLSDIPDTVAVHRAFTLDAGRHLSIRGRSIGAMALPDRWSSWFWTGRRLARRILRKERFDAIWSTYPIATAHRIGASIAAETGIPWVADFRDMMLDEWFPQNPGRRRWHERIERETVERSARVVVTTDGTREFYANGYGAAEAHKVSCIPNGFDERILAEIEGGGCSPRPRDHVHVVHSGILYTEERDPSALFEAISNVKKAGGFDGVKLRIVFRGSRHDDEHVPESIRLGIDDIVSFEPGIGYRDAITEMFESDGLLLMQGSNCNNQIPAKVYEYMRVGRPLLALTDAGGDTARLLEGAGYGLVAPLDDVARIESALTGFLEQIRDGSAPLPTADTVNQFARRTASRRLAGLLDEVAAGPD